LRGGASSCDPAERPQGGKREKRKNRKSSTVSKKATLRSTTPGLRHREEIPLARKRKSGAEYRKAIYCSELVRLVFFNCRGVVRGPWWSVSSMTQVPEEHNIIAVKRMLFRLYLPGLQPHASSTRRTAIKSKQRLFDEFVGARRRQSNSDDGRRTSEKPWIGWATTVISMSVCRGGFPFFIL